MKSMSKVLLLAVVALIVAQTVASAAPVTVTGIAAVESRRVASSVTGTNSNSTTLTIKNSASSAASAYTKAWIKWDLSSLYAANPGMQGHITGVTLTMTANTGATSKPLNIAGVLDGYTTNLGWTSTSIMWSNAPGNDITNALVDAAATTAIETGMSVTTVANTTQDLLVNDAEMISLLNADTDGIVQLIMYNGGQLDFKTHLQAGFEPKLSITYDVPEPATLAILGLGGLVLRRRLA